MSESLAIEARGLEKAYGRTRALAGLDLEVEAGAIIGMLGPNGAGKTTAVRVLTTLLRPAPPRGRPARGAPGVRATARPRPGRLRGRRRGRPGRRAGRGAGGRI